MNEDKYQNWLIVIASAAKTILMVLFGVIFLIAPNPRVFELLREHGVYITAPVIAICIFAFVLCYPTLISKHAREKWTVERRHQLFILGSAPVYLYFIALIVISLEMRMVGPGIISFTGIVILFLVLPSALFHGYRRSLELLSCGTMAVLSLFAAIAFAFMPASIIFNTINQDFDLNLVPMGVALTFLASSIGYFTMLFARNIPVLVKRVMFGILAIPVGLYGLQLTYNVLRQSAIISLTTPLGVIDLCLIIVLLGCAVFRPNYRSA